MTTVIIPPVLRTDGLQLSFDFEHSKRKLKELDHQREWDLQLSEDYFPLGRVVFRAYQFLADGVERRSIVLTYIELERDFRGQGKSYDVTRFVLDTVAEEADRDWGPVHWPPVIFIEKKDLGYALKPDRANIFAFLKKVSERVLGIEAHHQVLPAGPVIAVIGENVSLQLIEGHLARSVSRRVAL